jgi:signal transduction histidine kinase
MWWEIGVAANLIVAAAYLAISWAILHPLLATKQVRSNRLGTATAAIFFTCAVHHGSHSVHMLLPSVGLELASGRAMRTAFDWHQVVWDVVTAGVGVYYWTLRSTYGSLMKGAALFQDMKERQRQALEINDNIVQGLAVAKLALELNEREASHQAMESALDAARQIITDLLGEAETENRLGPGDLVRTQPATVNDGG